MNRPQMAQRLLRHFMMDVFTGTHYVIEMDGIENDPLVTLIFYAEHYPEPEEALVRVTVPKAKIAELTNGLNYWVHAWSQPRRDYIASSEKEDQEWLKKYPPRRSLWKRITSR